MGIILIIPVLVNVAFVTLLERKILGYSQIRKGPNKVRIIGIAQPFNDAIKLFSKEIILPKPSNFFQFFLFPLKEFTFSIRQSIIFIYIVLSLNVYPVLIS